MVLVPILLLNMLIAMMGNTYAHVIEQSEKEFVKQWAKIVVSLERAVSQKDAHNYLQEYSIKLGPGDDPNNPASEQRGVMVIKSKSKTRARQRKGAVANWKRVGKVTINELKKRGMTGEELRCIMWGRASISTPVRASPHIKESEISASAAVAGGFGEALTAALDVMAFTHDIDLDQATEGIPTTNSNVLQQAQVSSVQSSKSPTVIDIKGKTHRPDSEDVKIAESTEQKAVESKPIEKNRNIINRANQRDQTQSIGLSSKDGENMDPLLSLIIASENPESQHVALLKLAEEARMAGEIKVKLDSHILESFGLGVAPAELENCPISEEKDKFLDESSDDICGNNLLGTDSRLRRIRSATIRYSTSKFYCNKQNGIEYSTSSSDENSQNFIVSNHVGVNESSRLEAPGNLENKTEGVKLEVKDRSENEKLEKNQHKQQQHVNKNHKRRVKTAKNRVTPKEVNAHENDEIQMKKNDIISPPTSPTDPLEPWSTRGISDMNTILAWRENGLDSP